MIYELFYLVGEAKEPELPKIKDAVKKIVEKEGGKWLDPEITEKRKMTYKIKGQFRGIYIARRFEFSERDLEEQGGESFKNTAKQINLNKDVLRFIIAKASDLPELKTREEIKKEALAAEKKIPATKKKLTASGVEAGEKKSIDEKLEEILNI
jgi:ribosomal protein S6